MVAEQRTFRDRHDAGRRLATAVRGRLGAHVARDVVVLGLPRGGVPVAAEVADALGATLDVVVVRKVGAPDQPELALGAVGEGGVLVRNDDVIRALGVARAEVEAAAARQAAAVAARVRAYRGDAPAPDLTGRVVVVVDDGLATGATALAACRVVRRLGASRVVLAVPVAPGGWRPPPGDVDEVVCVASPAAFGAVGQWYDDFRPTSDDEVVAVLSTRRGRTGTG